MGDGYDLLEALAMVLGVAAVTTFVCRLARLPIVFGYVVAGLLIGPHVPFPLVAEPHVVHTLSELGVVLLMFSLGLEFRLTKLVRVGPSVAITAILQCSLLLWLGFALGRAWGWTPRESFFAGAAIAISSTTIIAKVFDEQGIRGKLRDLVVGILIVEDLIAVLLMTILTGVATGEDLSPTSMAKTIARLGVFLAALMIAGLFVVPRIMRRVVRRASAETVVVSSVGICFGAAWLVRELGYSVALGAFMAGSLSSESGEQATLERLVQPVRDVFAAIFFVSVGMMINPRDIVTHWGAILSFSAIVVVGKIVGVWTGAFLTGNGVRTSIQTGMSLAQIGEFSFIIAGLGLSLHATRDFLYPIAVAISAITTLLTPWLVRLSGPVADWVDRKLPRPLQMLATLYGSWVERLRAVNRHDQGASTVRKLARHLAIDAALFASVIIVGTLGTTTVRDTLIRRGLVPARAVEIPRVAILGLLAAPFCVGIVRVGRKLGAVLADLALPPTEGQPDLALAARKALTLTLQLLVVLVVGIPLIAITQPFLPSFHGAEILFGIVIIFAFAAWKTAKNLEGHVRAGAQVIAQVLSRQAHTMTAGTVELPSSLTSVLHGLGEPVAVALEWESPAVGKSLGELSLRGTTGATVLAIARGDTSIITPMANERFQVGDIVALAGTREAILAARGLLMGPSVASEGLVG